MKIETDGAEKDCCHNTK